MIQNRETGGLVGLRTPVLLQGSEKLKVVIAASCVGLAAEQWLA